MTRFLVLVLLLLLVGCGPQATPFPADVPVTPSPVRALGTDSVRYALAQNTQGLVGDLPLIQASAQVEQLTEPINPDDLGKRYDIVVSYGDMAQGTLSPTVLHITLLLKTQSSPLNNPDLAMIVRQSVHPETIVAALNIEGTKAETSAMDEPRKIRAALGNLGWPDGISLNMAYAFTPGIAELVKQVQEVGIHIQSFLLSKADIQSAFDANRIQATLVSWTTAEERAAWVDKFGNDNVIDLYTLPISYRALPELKITFTPDGWPLASR